MDYSESLKDEEELKTFIKRNIRYFSVLQLCQMFSVTPTYIRDIVGNLGKVTRNTPQVVIVHDRFNTDAH